MVPLAWSGKTGGIRSQEVGGYLKTKVCETPKRMCNGIWSNMRTL